MMNEPGSKREGKVVEIMNRLQQLEESIKETEAKLNSFSEELFGFVHDTDRESLITEKGNCGTILYRVTTISSILNSINIELNTMQDELPQKTER